MYTSNPLTTLTISLEAIASNYRLIQQKGAGREVSAVVKANAYGLGMAEVAPALYKAGCRRFFVVSLDEALELRKILSDVFIGVFYGVNKAEEEYFVKYNLTPAISTHEQFKRWQEYAVKIGKKLPAILHFDTGMNRLGLNYKDAALYKDCDNLEIELVMSHLACADIENNEKNAEQLARFREIKDYFPNKKMSFANSSGVFISEDYHFDILRPGAALYGINPVLWQKNPMQNVVTLISEVLQIRKIDTAQTVGYGASCKLAAGSVIATIPAGYADGYLSYLGNKGYCFINGRKCNIAGRVSMDLITIDITEFAEEIAVGSKVELIGDNVTVDDVAKQAGTIGYEILTSLGSRYKRIYL